MENSTTVLFLILQIIFPQAQTNARPAKPFAVPDAECTAVPPRVLREEAIPMAAGRDATLPIRTTFCGQDARILPSVNNQSTQARQTQHDAARRARASRLNVGGVVRVKYVVEALFLCEELALINERCRQQTSEHATRRCTKQHAVNNAFGRNDFLHRNGGVSN